MSAIRYTRLVLEIRSFTLNFLGIRQSVLHSNAAQQSFCPLQSYSRTL